MNLIPNIIIFSFLLYLTSCAPIEDDKIVYAVIVDAGSTGSRAVGYKFERNGKGLDLKEEKFIKTRPGLSSFAGKPQEGAKNITNLLDEMKSFIPEEEKPKTILYLRATAGLRLLKEKDADDLLNAVQQAFEKTEYNVTKDASAMLSGTDEGILSWFTVNYLNHKKRLETFATMEMGGGSAQVVYEPDCSVLAKLRPDVFPSPLENVKVFSRSYLGLGLSAGRHGILAQETEDKKLQNGLTVTSACYNGQNDPQTFFFNVMNITVQGKEGTKEVDVEACKKLALNYIKQHVKPYPLEFNEELPVALSAFYYRAKSAELISGPGGETNVKGIEDRMKENCAKVNAEDPFLCMDLVFIHTLIKEGFGLPDNKQIQVIHSIEDHELSWALGFAYSKLTGTSNEHPSQ